MKILYAAGNFVNAKIQLSRFLNAIQNKNYIIKIAAFKKSSPEHHNIHWTLDALLNMLNPNILSLESENLNIYFEQIKYFSPDLIISDSEYFSSYVGEILNIPVLQCSPLLINEALKHKYDIGLYKKYAIILNKNNWIENNKKINILDNSDFKFIYSHLGDMDNPPEIRNTFNWIRPYHTVGNISIPCQHNIVGATINKNINMIRMLQNNTDAVLFSEFFRENYNNINSKTLSNSDEYVCNLYNCKTFICSGQESFLADAFYNNKFAISFPDFSDPESIISSIVSEYFKLNLNIYNEENINVLSNKKINYNYNTNVHYLHEIIERL